MVLPSHLSSSASGSSDTSGYAVLELSKRRTKMNLKLASIIMVALVMMPLVGCTPAQTTDIVQKAVNVFSIGKQYVAAASSLVPELQQVNPQLAAEVSEYDT